MLSNKCLVAVCAVAFCCNIITLTLFVKFNTGEDCSIRLSVHQGKLNILPDDFLSVGVDTSQVEKYDELDFTNPKFREMAAALAPARIRLGGTMSERLIFSKDLLPSPYCAECAHTNNSNLPYFVMGGKKWAQINEFCVATGLKLLFTFNVLLRSNKGWNDTNAKDIISFSRSHGYKIDFQLGNEPNSFRHVFNMTVSPKQLAHDFRKLKHMLHTHGYGNSLVVGPDTTRPQSHHPECLKYMVEFLGNGSSHINVRSWHQYYLNSRTAKINDFWAPSTMDFLKDEIETMKSSTTKYNNIPMWLTETSSSYGGGAPGLSNTYSSTPLWVDKLGLSAKYNITTVIRQSLIGGDYGLLDSHFEPLPDWWVSVLYKRIVGNKVLDISCNCSDNQRMYAHCTKKGYTNDTSAVTIYAVNLEFKKVRFVLNGTALSGNDLDIDEYIISAPSNNRQTKIVLMNGRKLYYESTPPKFVPQRLKHATHISMPPYSIGFWVVKNTSMKVCK